MQNTRTVQRLRGPGFMFYRSPIITVPNESYVQHDVIIPDGYDQAVVQLSAITSDPTTLVYYLYQRAGQDNMGFGNHYETGNMVCDSIPGSTGADYRCSVNTFQHLASDVLRVQVFGTPEPPTTVKVQINVMFTKRTPDQPV